MTTKNSILINTQNNICENIIVITEPSDWTVPDGFILLDHDTTQSKIWKFDKSANDFIMVVQTGAGDIGDSWDGTYLITNQPKPTIS